MDVNVLTKGNRELIKMYGNLISLDYESAATLADTLSTNDSPHMNAITNEARVVFQTILAKKAWKIEEHKDLNPTMMDMGEKVFLGYAFTFAVRNALPFDLPVVFDKAYECLDSILRNGARVFLKQQICQQILLGSMLEFEEDRPHYTLDCTN